MKGSSVAGAVAAGLAVFGAQQAGAAGGAPTNAAVREIVVRETVLAEEAAVGPYDQPEWTTRRRFPTTRVYVQQPPGEAGVEQWWRMRRMRDGQVKHQLQQEVEFGLPNRFQADLYHTWVIEENAPTRHDNFAFELRHALADWGELPLNPTVYGEYKLVHYGADVVEAKLLLGDELAAGMHYGMNFVWEQELSDAKATEMAASAAVSRTVVDRRLSLGAEAKYVYATEEGSRGDPERKILLGPSLQWRPTPRSHVDVVPLFGLTDDAPRVESYVVLGFDFGAGDARESVKAPVSTTRN